MRSRGGAAAGATSAVAPVKLLAKVPAALAWLPWHEELRLLHLYIKQEGRLDWLVMLHWCHVATDVVGEEGSCSAVRLWTIRPSTWVTTHTSVESDEVKSFQV